MVAAAALGWGALSSGWYQLETDQQMSVGPLGAKRCGAGQCGVVSLDRLGVDPDLGRLGVLVAVTGALAALLLLGTAGLGLARGQSPRRLAQMAMVLAVFAACAGLAFHLLAPFAESMAVGPTAFVFFGGAALAAATAGVVFGALSSARK